MTDQNPNVTPDPTPLSGADETFGWTSEAENGNGSSAGKSPKDTGREWLSQLQTMIENVTEAAGPVLREVSAKAAELAAIAGDKAGPVAARAAELTAEAGTKLAERSRDLAAELRRDQATRGDSAETHPGPKGDDASQG
jgi:hypothetical protein